MTLTPDRWQQVLARLDALLEIDAAARGAQLAALQRDDAPLAQALRRLLAADAGSGPLDDGIDALAPGMIAELAAEGEDEAQTDRSGERIGDFVLQHLLGRGGMGEVYLAERADGDVRQQVALKVLKRGMDSVDIVRRFARERRILAHLNHPHIARFIDGGLSADGRPYYAMERVEGVPLTQFARDLPLRRRVELLATVCDAVAYAHAQLVVHRDLKPSNVLVDGNGQPRVLDFGIAKLLAEGEHGDATASGLRAMSPAYAAPEQILGQRIGIAADVYALGAMLYELLTGELPHRRPGESLAAMVAALEHETVLPPSTALRRQAGADDARRARMIDADLDLIVLQALKREPERRYGSAAALAEDLRRWLHGRPIAARPDTFTYRIGKFVRRHRGGVSAAVLVVLAVLGGLAAALWQADIAQREAERAREAAATAQREAKKSERLAAFLESLVLDVDPVLSERKETPTLLDVVREGGERVERELGAEPLLQAQLLLKFAALSLNLRDEEQATRMIGRANALVRALPDVPPETHAEALIMAGERRMAARELGEARKLLDEARQLLEGAGLAGHAMAASAHNLLSLLAYDEGRIDDSIAHAERNIAIYRSMDGDHDVRIAINLFNLAMMQMRRQHWEEAEANIRAAVAIDRKVTGTLEPRAGIRLNGLATVLMQRGRLEQAQDAAEESLAVLAGGFAPTDAYVLSTRFTLAEIATLRGDPAAAAAGYREVLRLAEQSGHAANIGRAHRGLGLLALDRGDTTEALQEFALARPALTKYFGEGHASLLTLAAHEAQALLLTGAAVDAVTRLRELMVPLAAKAGEPSADVVHLRVCLAEALLEAGRHGEAAAEARSALGDADALLGRHHRWGTRAMLVQGLALAASGDAAAAQPLLRDGIARAEAQAYVGGPLPLLARARAARPGG